MSLPMILAKRKFSESFSRIGQWILVARILFHEDNSRPRMGSRIQCFDC